MNLMECGLGFTYALILDYFSWKNGLVLWMEWICSVCCLRTRMGLVNGTSPDIPPDQSTALFWGVKALEQLIMRL
jgi:hypothetical protein